MQLGLASSRQDAIGWLSTCSSIRQACLGVYAMNLSVLPSAEKVGHPTELSVKVELDERCFLFPDGKHISHLLFVAGTDRNIALEAVFSFNQTRRSPRILEVSLSEAQGFVRELVNAVYYAKTSFFLSSAIRVSITVAANGYHMEFLRADQTTELLISAGAIWRFIKGVLVAIDSSAPVVSN